MESKLKEMTKAWKKNAARMEENSRTVLSRVGEMAGGVQIIAENVDSLNDVGKRLETIDEVKEALEELDSLPQRLQGLEDRLEEVRRQVGDAAAEATFKFRELEAFLDGSKGRKVSTDEYGDVTNLLVRLEEENSKKFCEFGGLVETLQVCDIHY